VIDLENLHRVAAGVGIKLAAGQAGVSGQQLLRDLAKGVLGRERDQPACR
jgi:hypothetical protein